MDIAACCVESMNCFFNSHIFSLSLHNKILFPSSYNIEDLFISRGARGCAQEFVPWVLEGLGFSSEIFSVYASFCCNRVVSNSFVQSWEITFNRLYCLTISAIQTLSFAVDLSPWRDPERRFWVFSFIFGFHSTFDWQFGIENTLMVTLMMEI